MLMITKDARMQVHRLGLHTAPGPGRVPTRRAVTVRARPPVPVAPATATSAHQRGGTCA